MKLHEQNTVTIDGNRISYFFTREKSDVNGNPRYKVFIIDPESPAVFETIFKCYQSQIPERVIAFVENTAGITVPF